MRSLLALLPLLCSAGCAATGGPPAPLDPAAPPSLLEIHDPLEPMNRAVYRFNSELDEYVLIPVVNGYRLIVPEVVRTGVGNFFDNLLEVTTAANGLLQARPEVTSRAIIRFAVNSTIGILGIFDVATAAGVERQREDFGQTLGWWGVPHGPYVVLPALGPSGVRDATGTGVDFAASLNIPIEREIYDVVYANPAVIGLWAVDARHQQSFRYFGTGSPFEYELVRYLYRKQREIEIAR